MYNNIDDILVLIYTGGIAQLMKLLPTETYFSLVRQQLSENKQAFVRVTGMSMWPLLRHLRDGVTLVPPDCIRKGDIVLFDRMNGRYALHRVIRKGKMDFTMAGDNQWYMESGLPYTQVVGVVSSIHRAGKVISCEKFFLRFYSLAVTWLAFPRIYMWKVVEHTAKFFRRHGNRQKGAGE